MDPRDPCCATHRWANCESRLLAFSGTRELYSCKDCLACKVVITTPEGKTETVAEPCDAPERVAE
jgi:hypothetical protein